MFTQGVNAQDKHPSSNKLFMVKQQGKYGFKNGSGKVVIPANYDATFPFSEGVTPVKKMANGIILTLWVKPFLRMKMGNQLITQRQGLFTISWL